MPPAPRLLHSADTALTVEFGADIDPALNRAVLALERRVLAAALPGVVETVPTYRSLTLHLDPSEADPETLGETVLALAEADPEPAGEPRRWRVPVVYGGAFGLDLDAVAAHHRMGPDEVVARHSAPDYRVFMVGFLPGYAYLGGLDPALALSRRPEPRPITPAGTISIGGRQALIASVAAPSGWHLLGRTPVRSFMPGRDPVFLFEPGDVVRFEPVPAAAWAALDARAAAGEPVAAREPP